MSTLRMVVITDPETAMGFRLAGVETITAGDPTAAHEQVRRVIMRGDTGLVVLNQTYFNGLDSELQRHSDEGKIPLLIALPEWNLRAAHVTCELRMMEFLRHIVGWKITFRKKEE